MSQLTVDDNDLPTVLASLHNSDQVIMPILPYILSRHPLLKLDRPSYEICFLLQAQRMAVQTVLILSGTEEGLRQIVGIEREGKLDLCISLLTMSGRADSVLQLTALQALTNLTQVS